MENQYEKQEKLLWYVQIVLFLGAILTYFSELSDAQYQIINLILAVVSVVSLSTDRFYFNQKLEQQVYPSYAVAYLLIVIYMLVLILQFAGAFHLGFFAQERTKLAWVLVPALSLLWKTKFIAFREWDQNA